MRAVAVVVEGVVVPVHEVPTAPVVDEAVAVVVAPSHRIERIHPALVGEVGMGEVDAGIGDGDDDVESPVASSQASGASMSLSFVPPVSPVLCRPQSWPNDGSFGVAA